ncbi:class IV adenylate cyclase [Gynuella sp.]|uniref:class IV adenylate cyclase n=1 Tax=Gynuella sp. TaxID=2969146 RepID=UPI003D0CC07E
MNNQHFIGQYEVEFKYRLPSKALFWQTLTSMSYETMLENNIEQDLYFDTPNRELTRHHKSLCIRQMRPSDICLWIVKGPEPDRCEAVNITDTHKAASMLKTMGYDVIQTMTKTRSIYFLGEYHVTLDHLDGLGDFAEFAIMTDDSSLLERYKDELKEVAARFGLTDANLETRSYRDMVQVG